MKNEAFQILIDAEIISEDKLMDALRDGGTLRLNGPWEGSDYSGDDITESNQRSLARDYPALLIDHDRSWGHCEYWLEIDPLEFGKPVNREFAVELAEVLSGLKCDYPLYDECDNSALIHERAEKAWDSFLRMDLQREVSEFTGVHICLDDMEDVFWELLREHDIWPETEGHRDVIFRGIRDEKFIRDLATRAVYDGGLDPWTISDLTDEGYELVGEWMARSIQLVHEDQLSIF